MDRSVRADGGVVEKFRKLRTTATATNLQHHFTAPETPLNLISQQHKQCVWRECGSGRENVGRFGPALMSIHL